MSTLYTSRTSYATITVYIHIIFMHAPPLGIGYILAATSVRVLAYQPRSLTRVVSTLLSR